MRIKKEFDENIIVKIVSYFYMAFISNLLLIIMNFIFLFSLFIIEVSFAAEGRYFEIYNIIIIISILPGIPAVSAIFAGSLKLIKEKDVLPFKDFFIFYKKYFVKTIKVSSIYILFIIISTYNRYYFIQKMEQNEIFNSMGYYLSTSILFISIISMIFSLYIIIEKNISVIETMKFSLYLIIKLYKASIILVFIIVLGLFLSINFRIFLLISFSVIIFGSTYIINVFYKKESVFFKEEL